MEENQTHPPRSQNEKDEKQEKEVEKQEEKGESIEEKWERDPIGTGIWALILIWAGIAFLISNMGWLDGMERINAWTIIMIGGGLLLLAEVAIRLIMPEYRRPIAGTLIMGLVFLAIGLGDLISLSVVWPLIIIGVGVAIIVRGLLQRR